MRKHIFSLLTAVLLFALLLSGTAFAETATVTGTDVNVREGPGKTYRVIGSLSGGSTVEVLDRSDSGWYAVSFNGSIGYMSSDYLTILLGSTVVQKNTIQGQPADLPGQATIQTAGQPQAPAAQTQAAAPADQGQIIITMPAAQTAPADQATPAAQGAAAAQTQPAYQNSTEEKGYINGMYVRLRSGPSTEYSVHGEYNRGKALTILGVIGDWTFCRIDGQEGYVFSQYVAAGTPPAQTQQPADNAGNTQTAVNTGGQGTPNTVDYGTAPVAPQTNVQGQTTVLTEAPVFSSPKLLVTPVGGTIIADHTRFRKGPSDSYSIITSYDRGKEALILGSDRDWIYCSVDGQKGYIHSLCIQENAQAPVQTAPQAQTPVQTQPQTPVQPQVQTPPVVQTGGTAGYIKGNNVRFREAPDLSSRILCELFYGNVVTILGSDGVWSSVIYNGQAGYVFSQYVVAGTFQNTVTGGTATGRQVADFALQYVGSPYCWGGIDPSTGFDCSGFTYFVYGHFGYTLNRVAAEQALNGRHVEAAELQPGDLLCFYSGGSYIGHVGIYIGNNMFVHAATSGTGVVTSELTGYYAGHGFEVRRII